MPQDIVIVGGGTAGWMSAALLRTLLDTQQFTITLIESPDIGIIGVGEGSTPQLRTFFETLGIAENEWMNACNATFKNGIRFNHWTTGAKNNSYFHPFPSPTDVETARAFLINCHKRLSGVQAHSHPDTFFLTAELSERGKGPKVEDGQSPLPVNYAYHFDSVLLGRFIRDWCIKQGVRHIQATIDSVSTHLNGDIASVISTEGAEYKGDWFIDCSGFTGLLIQKTLKTPFIPFADNLFNDSAVAIATPRCETFKAQTEASALSNGWAWKIPLQHRTGNGYVYSSAYCSPDAAECELRQHLDVNDDTEARHLHMNVGRCNETWVNNCVAVGLSQGFIEPLEATALHIVQETIQTFVSAFTAGSHTRQHQQQFNHVINARIDGIRDYIVCHFQMSNRNDSQYWRDNVSNSKRSDSLSMVMEVWRTGGDLSAEIQRQNIQHYYPVISWYCLLAGYDAFQTDIAPASALEAKVQRHIDKLCGVFQDHSMSITS